MLHRFWYFSKSANEKLSFSIQEQWTIIKLLEKDLKSNLSEPPQTKKNGAFGLIYVWLNGWPRSHKRGVATCHYWHYLTKDGRNVGSWLLHWQLQSLIWVIIWLYLKMHPICLDHTKRLNRIKRPKSNTWYGSNWRKCQTVPSIHGLYCIDRLYCILYCIDH